MKNRILLIEPPFYRLHNNSYSLDRFPFALAYLSGAILQNTNWDVKAYNADFIPSYQRKKIGYLTGKGFNNYIKNLNNTSTPIWEEIKNVILDYKPNVIGLSVKSTSYISALNVSSIAKGIDKNIKIIFGGPYPTMAKKNILKNSLIDIAVIGEGELTIVELLNSIEQNQPFNLIKGVIFRSNENIIKTPQREFIENLSMLPFPHEIAKKVLHDYEKYPSVSFKNIFASRGCPYGCNFCASKEIWTRKVRYRSVENVVSEIEGIMKLGVKRIHFDDDTFGISKNYIKSLCNEIKRKCPTLKWSCEIRADIINDETVSIMKKAGCETIQMGFESGNDRILRLMGKNLTVDKLLKACQIIRNHKIELQTFFLVGYPYETEETLMDTKKMMGKSKSDKIIYSIFTPYPYTAIYEFCKEKGLIPENFDATIFNHQSPLNSFSMFIPQNRFRFLARKIEIYVDRRNLMNRIKSILLLKGFPRMNELINEYASKLRLKKSKDISIIAPNSFSISKTAQF